MTYTQLEAGFAGCADGALSPEQTRRLLDVWNAASRPDAALPARLAAV